MKAKTLLFIFSMLIIFNYQSSHAQGTTVTIDLSNSVIGMERSGAPSVPAPAVPDLGAYSWTCDGIPCIGRTLMSIDLSAIPTGATIIDARLSLYADPFCTYIGYYGQPTYGTVNRGVVKRITSAWDPNTVTWNNKPTSTKAHQLKLNSSNSTSQDYLNKDVTAMVQDMIDHPSYGILLQMNDEVNYYKSLIFGSNLNAVESLRPKLIVTYTTEGGGKENNASSIAVWDVEVFPNPASQELTFDFTDINEGDMVQLSVFSIAGQLIHSEVITDAATYTMNIARLNAGMYFFKVENQTTHINYSGKFLKQ